jgi:alpha-methylacyl-CoA racemase
VSVLDLSVVGPASRCTRILSDFGADVVKVGPVPGRGPASADPPFFSYAGSRFMKHVKLDLRDEEGRETFFALADSADVLIESFRPGVTDRLGIGYGDMSARNPRLVYCSTSGYGQDGPRSSWAGHDLDYLAVSGYLAMTESADGNAPPIPGATIADAAAGGMHAALSIIAALFGRQSSGVGTYLDVSVADGALWLMSLVVDEHLATGSHPAPGHDVLSGRYACYGTYLAADGRALAVGAIESKFFTNLCNAIGCEKWIEHQYDDSFQDEIRSDLAAAFAAADRDTWTTELAGSDTCVAPILEPSEVADDSQYESRGAFVEAVLPNGERFSQVGAVLAGMPRPPDPVELPDLSVTDTAELLERAGFPSERISELISKGVLA